MAKNMRKNIKSNYDPELVQMCGQFLEDHAEWLKKHNLTEEEYLKENPSYAQNLEYACSVIKNAPYIEPL